MDPLVPICETEIRHAEVKIRGERSSPAAHQRSVTARLLPQTHGWAVDCWVDREMDAMDVMGGLVDGLVGGMVGGLVSKLLGGLVNGCWVDWWMDWCWTAGWTGGWTSGWTGGRTSG